MTSSSIEALEKRVNTNPAGVIQEAPPYLSRQLSQLVHLDELGAKEDRKHTVFMGILRGLQVLFEANKKLGRKPRTIVLP